MKRIVKLNNKGITVLEAIIASVILILIISIGFLVYNNSKLKTKVDYYEKQKGILADAAENYYKDNDNELPSAIGEPAYVNVDDLVKLNYVSPVYKVDSEETCYGEYDESSFIRVTKYGVNDYVYDVYLSCFKEGNDEAPIITMSFSNAILDNDDTSIINAIDLSIKVEDKQNDKITWSYRLIDSDNLTTGDSSNEFTTTLNEKGLYKISVRAEDTNGNKASLQYIVTIGKLDAEKPTVFLHLDKYDGDPYSCENINDETCWTNRNVVQTIYVNDYKEIKGFLYSFDTITWRLFEGSAINVTSAVDVSTNVFVQPLYVNGMTSDRDYWNKYTIRIDKTIPTVEFDPISGNLEDQELKINVKDNLSGIEKFRYKVSNDGGLNYGAWSDYIKDDTTTLNDFVSKKEYKILIEVIDKAGNVGQITSNTYSNKKTTTNEQHPSPSSSVPSPDPSPNEETKPSKPNIGISNNECVVAGNLTVAIATNEKGTIKYKLGATEVWNDYVGPFIIKENTIIYSKVIVNGIESDISTLAVDNIKEIKSEKICEGTTLKVYAYSECNPDNKVLAVEQKNSKECGYVSNTPSDNPSETSPQINNDEVTASSSIPEYQQEIRDYYYHVRVWQTALETYLNNPTEANKQALDEARAKRDEYGNVYAGKFGGKRMTYAEWIGDFSFSTFGITSTLDTYLSQEYIDDCNNTNYGYNDDDDGIICFAASEDYDRFHKCAVLSSDLHYCYGAVANNSNLYEKDPTGDYECSESEKSNVRAMFDANECEIYCFYPENTKDNPYCNIDSTDDEETNQTPSVSPTPGGTSDSGSNKTCYQKTSSRNECLSCCKNDHEKGSTEYTTCTQKCNEYFPIEIDYEGGECSTKCNYYNVNGKESAKLTTTCIRCCGEGNNSSSKACLIAGYNSQTTIDECEYYCKNNGKSTSCTTCCADETRYEKSALCKSIYSSSNEAKTTRDEEIKNKSYDCTASCYNAQSIACQTCCANKNANNCPSTSSFPVTSDVKKCTYNNKEYNVGAIVSVGCSGTTENMQKCLSTGKWLDSQVINSSNCPDTSNNTSQCTNGTIQNGSCRGGKQYVKKCISGKWSTEYLPTSYKSCTS